MCAFRVNYFSVLLGSFLAGYLGINISRYYIKLYALDFATTQAVTFVGFLTGFVVVLCIGNYFRAKRAQERQRQRRLAKLGGGGGVVYERDGGGSLPDSPRSQYSATSSAYTDEGPEHHHLLHQRKTVFHASRGVVGGDGGTSLYRTQQLNPQHRQTSIGQLQHPKHSAQYSDEEADLLMIPEEDHDRKGPSSDVMSV